MTIDLSNLLDGKKIYFASDFHLGFPDHQNSRNRELKIVQWLDSIKDDAQGLILVGDLFDFWFEYKHVVPKGYVRFMSKLAELSERGIQIFIFIGNHDLWFNDYFPKEVGVKILKKPTVFSLNGKKFFVAHGDGLGRGQQKFKFVKWFFTNSTCQWIFRWLHPDVGIALANLWSGASKKRTNDPEVFHSKLIEFSESIEGHTHHDFYVYGDCHDDTIRKINGSKYVNLGEWIHKCSYGVFDGEEILLKAFNP